MDTFIKQLSYAKVTIDVLFNNAALGTFGELWKDVEPKEILKTLLDVNYRGPVSLTAFLIPFMSEDAKIINISSQTGCLDIFKPTFHEYLEKYRTDTTIFEKKLIGLHHKPKYIKEHG